MSLNTKIKRRQVGLLYSYNPNWIGGTYYVENLINSFNNLEEERKPEVILLISKPADWTELLKRVSYPRIRKWYLGRPQNKWLASINFRIKRLMGVELIPYRKHITGLDVVYPVIHISQLIRTVKTNVFWRPDFQEKALPSFFTDEEIRKRDEDIIKAIEHCLPLVFSSYKAKSDFIKYFGHHQPRNKMFVIPFAVHHPEKITLDRKSLEKYHIHKPYFIIANQFWVHKNHLTVLKAISLLPAAFECQFVFTGSTHDPRNPGYYSSLEKFIRDANIETRIKIVGFIDRHDQLSLIAHSRAVIQPSQFEGWSSVVEDAKSLAKDVILSDIELHREQMPDAIFFSTHNERELAEVIATYEPRKISRDYSLQQTDFATKFVEMVDGLSN